MSALVRGGWPHFWAEVWTEKKECVWVNWKTGEVEGGKGEYPSYEVRGHQMICVQKNTWREILYLLWLRLKLIWRTQFQE